MEVGQKLPSNTAILSPHRTSSPLGEELTLDSTQLVSIRELQAEVDPLRLGASPVQKKKDSSHLILPNLEAVREGKKHHCFLAPPSSIS